MQASKSQAARTTQSLAFVLLMVAANLAILAAPVSAQTIKNPALAQVLWDDSDNNGHLDTVYLGFGDAGALGTPHPLDMCTIRPTDFEIDFGAAGGGVVKALSFAEAPNYATQCPGPVASSVVTLRFREETQNDGGGQSGMAFPVVRFTPDPDGVAPTNDTNSPPRQLASFTYTCPSAGSASATKCGDIAVPFMLGAFAVAGDTAIQAVFSEPIHQKGKAGNVAPAATDFCLSGPAASHIAISPGGTGHANGAPSFNTAASSQQRVVVLRLEPPTPTGSAYTLTAADLASGQLLLSVNAGCSTSNVEDVQLSAATSTLGNPAYNACPTPGASCTPATALPVAPPTLTVFGSVGDNVLVFQYSGPVATAASAAVPYSGAGSAVSINGCSGCTSGLAVVSADNPLGSDRAVVTLNAPLSATDLASNHIRLQSNTGLAAGLGSSATVDTSPLYSITDTARTGPYGKSLGLSGRTTGGVAVLGLETVDETGGAPDGRLDGIRITFNEKMQSMGATSEWCVQRPGVHNCLNLSGITFTSGTNVATLLFDTATIGDRATGLKFRVSHASGSASDQAGNLLPSFQKWGTTDAALPILLDMRTRDVNQNGRIDAVELNFSEPIQDSTFDYQDWSLDGGYTVSGFSTNCPGQTAASDACVLLTFAERTNIQPDTNARPNMTYLRNGGALQDAFGLNFQSTYAKTQVPDGAPPVLLTARGSSGATRIHLEFSEPVDGSAASRAIQTGDLRYIDGGGSGSGASGLSTVSDDVIGDRFVDAFANQALTDGGDLGGGAAQDRICPRTPVLPNLFVRDQSTNVAPFFARNPNAAFVPTPDTACRAISRTGAPSMTFATVDANHDGYLDAVKVSFNEETSDGDHTLVGSSPTTVTGDTPVIRVDVTTGAGCAVGPDACDRVYADVDDSSTVSPGDVRLRAFGALAAGTVVSTSDGDVASGASPVANVTAVLRVDQSPFGFTDPNDFLYVNLDGDNAVSVGDFRLKGPGTLAQNAPVAAGNSDLGSLVAPTAQLLRAADWKVSLTGIGNVPVTGVVTGDAKLTKPGCDTFEAGLTPIAPRGPLLPDAPNDKTLFLCIRPVRDPSATLDPSPFHGPLRPDTGAVLRVNYTGGNTPTGIVDLDGDAVGSVTNQVADDGAQPVLLTVQGGAGSNVVTLTFSEKVNGSGAGGNLTAGDLIYSNGCSDGSLCGASNVLRVDVHGGNSATAIVTLNAPLTACDILGSTGAGGPCPNVGKDGMKPRATVIESTLGSSGKSAYFPVNPVTILDNVGPDFRGASILDVNGDGVVDALQVRFTEPIDDTAVSTAGFVNSWTVKVGAQNLLVKNVVSGDYLGNGPCALPLSPTPDFANDHIVFLCLDATQNAAQKGTKDLGTGLSAGPGPWTVGFAVQGTCNASNNLVVRDLASPPNLMKCVGFANKPVDDLARPVIVAADTADYDADGRIDAMVVQLSEPLTIGSTNYKPGEWTVIGRTLTGDVVDGLPSDNIIAIGVNEARSADTGLCSVANDACPDVGYISGGTLADASGNTLRPVPTGPCSVTIGVAQGAGGCVKERDRAAPVVTEVLAQVGTATVTLTFSEAVCDANANPCLSSPPAATPAGTITPADFDYRDFNSGDASGITRVVHNPGENKTALTLNRVISAADFPKDEIGIFAGAVVEFNDQDSPGFRLQANTGGNRLDGTSLDRIPPGPVSGLKVPADTILPTSLVLSWTAPNGTTDSDLARYDIRVCQPVTGTPSATCITTDTDFNSAVKATTPSPPTPQRGKNQTYTVLGLKADTPYCFAVKVVDVNGNIGRLPSQLPVCARTLQNDTSAPGAVGSLTKVSVLDTGIKLSWIAPGDDASGTGTVRSYQVAACTADPAGNVTKFTACITPNVVYNPSTLASVGSLQEAQISGLQPLTGYFIVVRALDEVRNAGPLSSSLQVTTLAAGSGGGGNDLSAPGPVTALQGKAGSAPGTVELSWTVPSDDVGVTAYDVRQSSATITAGNFASATAVTPNLGSILKAGQTQTATVSGLTPGTVYHFAVAAKDAAGNRGAASGDVAITLTAAITQDELGVVIANTDVVVTHTSEGNTIAWAFPSDAPNGIMGVQVWKNVNGVWTQVGNDILSTDDAFNAGEVTDPDGVVGDEYRVTPFYGGSAAEGHATSESVASLPGFSDQAAVAAREVGPAKILGLAWYWFALIVLLVVLVVVGIVIAVTRKGRGGAVPVEEVPVEAEGAYEDQPIDAEPVDDLPTDVPPDAQADAYAPPAAAEAAPAAAAAATPAAQVPSDAPIHYVNCPKCATQFSAQGVKPLAIRCPSCGVRGVLR